MIKCFDSSDAAALSIGNGANRPALPGVNFLDIGDDFCQLDEAPVQHDSQLGAGGPLGGAGCQQALQGLQQHRHRLCHHCYWLQRPGVTLETKHDQPAQSLQEGVMTLAKHG